jgi:ATP-dependent Zn protease
VREAIDQTLRNRWWITAFFVLELLRQINYLVLEHWRGYYAFWTGLWGGIDGGVEKLNPWTRYRISRVFKALAAIGLLNGFVAWRTGRGFWEQLPHLPGDIGDFLFSTTQQMPFIFQVLLTGVFLIGQFALLFWFLSKGGIETYFPDDIRTRFTDVWGQDPVLDKVKENLIFLEDPKSIESRGGHVPSGILLYGPPGTGKTLMAESIAGETGLPFVFVEPGAFMNMFMGVGVLKVRGLFKKVRKLALKYGGVIVFFDEADSLGKRSLAAGGGMATSPNAKWDSPCNGIHYLSEGTQTLLWQQHFHEPEAEEEPRKHPLMMGGLNSGGGDMMALQALLAGLSGMTKPRGFFNRVVRRTLGMRPKAPPKYRWLMVMATNMPNSLDQALLRPGRIDRIYKVGFPSKEGRKRTFEGYLSRVKHELTDEQIDQLAIISPYATGATIKDTVNEALVFAIRDGRDTITWPDVLRAKHEKTHGVPDDWEYIDREGHAVAIHEACHAISLYRLNRTVTIDVATIERRDTTGGFVAWIPIEDRFSKWKSEREIDIMTSLASLAGERMFFDGDNSIGVGGDLGNATTVAMEMEAFHAMGSTVASHRITKAENAQQSVETGSDRMWLETEFGQRVEARLQELLDQVAVLIDENRILVLALAHAMEAYKTVSGEDVRAIIEGEQGPIIDGRVYHDPVFQARLEEYHEAALHAHQHAARVAIPLPGGESRDPVPVGLAASSAVNPRPVPDTGSWGPPPAPPSYPAPPVGNGDAATAARATPTPAAPLPQAPKAKDANGDKPKRGKGKNGNGKSGNGKNGNGKNGAGAP